MSLVRPHGRNAKTVWAILLCGWVFAHLVSVVRNEVAMVGLGL